MASLKKRRYKTKLVYYIKHYDEHGKVRVVKGSTDKQVARQMAAQLEREVEKRKVGMIDDFMLHAKFPIGKHLADYQSELESRDNSASHIKNTITCCERIIKSCKFSRVTDLTEAPVNQFLKKLRINGLSVRSSNRHSTAIKGFAKWLWSSKRTIDHRLNGLQNLNVDIDRRHVRRALTGNDLAQLLEVTKHSTRVDKGQDWKFAGTDRHILYLVASMTGLRASELASLTVGDFNRFVLTLKVEAQNTKNHQVAVLPVHPDVAQNLSEYIKDKPSQEKIWPGSWASKKRAGTILKRDLQEAGIPYEDENGEVFDFHSLRVQFGTALARADVSLRKAQQLLRHSTPDLTARVYQKMDTTDLTSSINCLSIPTLDRTKQAVG